ncbi:hypothetical protein GCM10023178_75730 [Actinomadura luteofluorescens]
MGGGVVDVDLHEEAVALGFGEGVDAFGLDGVLGGEDEEGAGEGVGVAAEGDLAFGHDLQEGGLDLGGGAVDLVGEDEVDEDGAEFDVELFGGGVVDAGADDVGGDEVGGELEAGEGAADDAGEGADGEGLGDAGDAFQEAVAAGEECDDHAFDHVLLADDDLLDLGEGVLQEDCGLVDVGGGDGHVGVPHLSVVCPVLVRRMGGLLTLRDHLYPFAGDTCVRRVIGSGVRSGVSSGPIVGRGC